MRRQGGKGTEVVGAVPVGDVPPPQRKRKDRSELRSKDPVNLYIVGQFFVIICAF